MMSLPFFGMALALVTAMRGHRPASILLFALSLAAMLVLFKLHATDPIRIGL